MNADNIHHSLESMILTGGENDGYVEMSSQSDISEGAVGYSPCLSQWSKHAYNENNDFLYHEECEISTYEQEVPEGTSMFIFEKPKLSTNSQANDIHFGIDLDYAAAEKSNNRQRRHSCTEIQHQSLPILNDVLNKQALAARKQESSQPIPTRIKSPVGPQRRSSIQVLPVNRQEVHLRRNSLQMDRPLCLSAEALMTLSSKSLSPNHNHFAYTDAPDEFARTGSDLFLTFLRDEIEQSHLQPPSCLLPKQDLPQSSRKSLENSEFIQMGSHLRQMADEFARSDQRVRVRQRAYNVVLSSLDFSSFNDLLFGMFQQGGVTCERVLVLFVFCSDLAIRALKEKLLIRFHELTLWSQQYIMSWLSPWVQHHGGWGTVFEQSVNEMYKVAVIGVCCMGMVAFWIYIRNNCH